jgi:DNA-binding NarL/FixJ family response regulator
VHTPDIPATAIPTTDIPRMNRPEITVYVYDAHDLVRAGLRGIIDDASGFVVVGSSGTESQALADIVRLRPAVALLGGCRGDDQALALCQRIRFAMPSVACVVAPTAIEHPFGPSEAAAAGADAFLMKRLHGFPLLDTISDVARGGHPLVDAMARTGAR